MNDAPGEIHFECPDCDDITLHDVLKGKSGKSSLDATLKCQGCGKVRTTMVRFPKQIKVKLVVSDGAFSSTKPLVLEDDDLLKVGDEFNTDDGLPVKISALELAKGMRSKTARATQIRTVWAIKFDVIDVKVSINDDRRTYSKSVPSSPDDEFTIGNILSFDDMDCLVHSIKVKERMMRRGTVEARDIVRIYGKFRKRSYNVLDLDEST